MSNHRYKDMIREQSLLKDDLLSQNYDLEDERDDLKNQIINLEISLSAKQKEIELRDEEIEENEKIFNKKYERLQNKYEIVQPRIKAEDAKQALKLCDSHTKNVIIKYLELDNYELVKNLASVTNKDNASDIINHRDGAIGRNTALIQVLNDSIDKRPEFYDKIESELKMKTSRATKEI